MQTILHKCKKTHILINKNSEFIPLKVSDHNDFSLESSSPLDPRFTFKNFGGKITMNTFAAAKKVSENDLVSFNPIFIRRRGIRKDTFITYHSLGYEGKGPKRKVVYLSAEKFLYEFVKSLRCRIQWLSKKIRSVTINDR